MRIALALPCCLIAAALVLSACGGGSGSDGSSSGSAPLGTANSDAAAGDAASLALDSSLAMSLSGYYVPAATVSTTAAQPRFLLRTLGDLLVRQAAALAQAETAPAQAPAATPAMPAGMVTAATPTVETVPCDGGGSYTLTSATGSVAWAYSACIDAVGNTLDGQVASIQLDSVTYQGDFTRFSITPSGQTSVQVDGRLVYSSNATATEIQAPRLSIAMAGYSLTLADYLWRSTDTGTETRIDARGRASTTGPGAYGITFDNMSDDADQAPFYVADGDTYAYTGSLEIQDLSSANRIVLKAMNSMQLMLEKTISGQVTTTWPLWSDVL